MVRSCKQGDIATAQINCGVYTVDKRKPALVAKCRFLRNMVPETNHDNLNNLMLYKEKLYEFFLDAPIYAPESMACVFYFKR